MEINALGFKNSLELRFFNVLYHHNRRSAANMITELGCQEDTRYFCGKHPCFCHQGVEEDTRVVTPNDKAFSGCDIQLMQLSTALCVPQM